MITPAQALACWASAAADTCIARSASRCAAVRAACCFANCASVFRVAALVPVPAPPPFPFPPLALPLPLAPPLDEPLPPDFVVEGVFAAVTAAAWAVMSAASVALA